MYTCRSRKAAVGDHGEGSPPRRQVEAAVAEEAFHEEAAEVGRADRDRPLAAWICCRCSRS